MCHRYISLFFIIFLIHQTTSLPDEGKWYHNITKGFYNVAISKSLFKDAQFFISINCFKPHDSDISIDLIILPSPCWDSSITIEAAKNIQANNYATHSTSIYRFTKTYRCSEDIQIDTHAVSENQTSLKHNQPVYTTLHDGVYVLMLKVIIVNQTEFNVGVNIEIQSSYGYLSAVDWPLLPFYGFMCIVYVILGLGWLVMSFMQWRDLLRVQFWIGGVILLGMLEKATFYAEYQSINNTGMRVQGAMLFAEWVSCAKRTLARMLVVIVSLGFGIVKPRLGSTLHRIVSVGLLYFCLAASEAYLRVMQPKNVPNRDVLVASVPLAVLDSAICWWIFSALVNTTRTLRLRRNEIKLSLYRHFTNTLIFSVIASICFMLYSIKTHRLATCLTVWKDLWLEEAYWHILFSALLLVIMILWRPTNNNQRYAFVPLLDTGEDEEEEQLVNDAYGVKVRVHHPKTSSKSNNSVDEELRWLEENVKSDPALPILDSDEEMVNTRFEVSKMQ